MFKYALVITISILSIGAHAQSVEVKPATYRPSATIAELKADLRVVEAKIKSPHTIGVDANERMWNIEHERKMIQQELARRSALAKKRTPKAEPRIFAPDWSQQPPRTDLYRYENDVLRTTRKAPRKLTKAGLALAAVAAIATRSPETQAKPKAQKLAVYTEASEDSAQPEDNTQPEK